MQPEYINYHQTHAFSPIVLDYIEGSEKLRTFYQYTPDMAGFEQAVKHRNFTGNRNLLVDILKQQYSHLSPPEVVIKNIDSLAGDQTFTITTGHQLNIFTGPLYFIYKIVTAIKLSADLKIKFPDYNFVPVYWMATEDHDFEEINNVRAEDKKIIWQTNAKGATGRLNTASMVNALSAYKGYLGITENGANLSTIVEKAYTNNSNLSDATRELVNALFGETGLVCIDADNAALKKQFAPVIAQDIFEQNSFKKITESSQALEKVAYKPQVNPREINFFYMDDQLRERIVQEDDLYKVLNTDISFTSESLQAEINNHPEKFSPNVVMRPLYQEIILPNLAYIGGGAEVTYWLQLKANFDCYQVQYPVLLLRNSAQIIDARSAQKMERLAISTTDLFENNELLKQNWIRKNSHDQLDLNEELQQMVALFEQIKQTSSKVEKGLAMTTEAAKVKTLNLLGNLEKKMMRAEKRKHTTAMDQIDHLKLKLFPNGVLQERVLNIAPMYVLYGTYFIESLIEAFEPLDYKFTVIYA